jgi:hypothetical protein
MKRNKRLVLLVSAIILAFVSVHVGYRLYKIHSILKTPSDFERMSVIPKTIEVCAEQKNDLVEVDIGYGTFQSAVDFNLNSAGSKHTVILGEADHVKLFIMPPHNPFFLSEEKTAELDLLKQLPADHPWRKVSGKSKDTSLDLLIRTEHAQLLPFSEVMHMSNTEFFAYLYQLVMKGIVSGKASEIFEYSTAHTRGLIHVVKTDEGKTKVACAIESSAQNIDVGFNFILSGDTTNNVIEIIEPILATLTFDEEFVCAEELITARISEAGIQPNK